MCSLHHAPRDMYAAGEGAMKLNEETPQRFAGRGALYTAHASSSANETNASIR